MGKRDYFKAIPAVYVLLEKDGKILLLRRANTAYYDGYYSLPAGHVEQAESLKTAAMREALEETGVTINAEDLRLVHVINRPTLEDNDDTRIDFFFATSVWQGTPKNNEPEKCSEVAWYNPDKLPKKEMIPEVEQAILAAYKGIIESEFGWSNHG